MAVASTRQSPAMVQQLTPPSSSHGGRESWDYAVPLDPTKSSFPDHDLEPFMSEDVTSQHPYSPHQPLGTQPNGVSKPYPRSNTIDSQGLRYDEEPEYTLSNRGDELHKQASGDLGVNGSDPNGVLDYHNTYDGARSKSRKKSKKSPSNWKEAEKNENNWIHRDKLKEIEIREMEAAGFKVGRSSRSNSRSQSARRGSRDRTNSEATDPTPNGDDRHEYRRVISPIPAEGDEEEAAQAEWDLRSPEEIAAEREQYAAQNTHVIRPSTSRIPIAKTSPLPVPHTFVERDQPLPRPRSSGNWDGDAIAKAGARVRSGSVSSQILLDDIRGVQDAKRSPMQSKFGTPTSPVSGTHPKAKIPGKPAPTSGARKVTPKNQTKPRNASAGSPVKRPGTSGGSISRPGTSHRPEGEAPWVATMYKPDPMLPPDQQIIPTHAKRLQQEQWESEGRVASAYDKDFRMLNTDTFENKRFSRILPIDIEKAQQDEQWPLPSPTKRSPERIDTRVRSPTSEQGGYRLTPTIPQSPRVASRAPSRASDRRTAPPISSNPTTTTRVPEPPAETENEKEKKGCCCIVM